MIKTFLTSFAVMVSVAASACWFTTNNFENNYIAGVNSYQAHYVPNSANGNVENAQYKNGLKVSLPLTVYVKVSPRQGDQAGEIAGDKPITKAVLQYKVLPNGKWITVRTIENVSWELDWEKPVALFGKNCINPEGLSSGTEIVIRLYLTDGTYETGDMNTDITSTIENNTNYSNGRYEGGWTAPYVFKVIYNGTRRAR